jgi:hypothetical protein
MLSGRSSSRTTTGVEFAEANITNRVLKKLLFNSTVILSGAKNLVS